MNGSSFFRKSVIAIALTLICSFTLSARAFAVDTQVVTLNAVKPISAGQAFIVYVNYDAYGTSGALKTTGIGIRVFFNSSMVSYYGFGAMAAGDEVTEPSASYADTGNLDNDDNTDQFLQMSWIDFSGADWPSGSLPQDLVELYFTNDSTEGTAINVMIYQKGSVDTTEAYGIDWNPPEILIQGDNPVDIDQGDTYTDAGATAFDVEDGVSVTVTADTSAVDTSVAGSYDVTYTAQDASGNEATVIRTVNVIPPPDTIPPVVTIIGDNPMEVIQGTEFIDPGATAEDNVDGTLTVTVIGTVNTAVVGTYTIIYKAVDAAGNSATQTRTVNVTADTIPPVISIIPPNPMTVYKGETFSDPGATAHDDVDGDIDPEIVSNNVDPMTPGNYEVVYRATDAAGNEATATREVRVELDSVPPVITIIGLETIDVLEGSVYNDLGATALDNVDGSVPAVTTSNNVNTAVPGSYQVVYEAVDSSDNTAIAVRTVNVLSLDTTPPVIEIIGDNPLTVLQGMAYAELGAIATDNVDGNVSVNVKSSNVNTSVIGTYQVVYEASDSAGNTATETRTVQVVEKDTTPPVIEILGDNPATVGKGAVYSDAGATATDNIDGPVDVTTLENNVNTAVIGTYQVKYWAKDSSNNTATSTRIVNVVAVDTEPPVISIVGDNPATVLKGSTYSDAGATATDNVDGPVTVTKKSDNVDTGTVGSYQVVYSATDSAGNEATAVRDVHVIEQDTTPPVIVITGDNPAQVLKGSTYQDAGATAVDDIDGAVAAIIKSNNVDTSTVGMYQVVYEASDNSGNTATATRTVNVVIEDSEPPVITITGGSPVEVYIGTTYSDAGATAVDNIDGSVAVQTTGNNVNTAIPGSYSVTYSAQDSAGNTATAERIVNVIEDDVPPVITIIGADPVTILQGQSYSDAGATATDNVDPSVTVQTVSNNVNTNVPGTYSVQYSATDSSGNTATATRTVTVLAADTTPPVITIHGSNPVTITVGSSYTDAGASASDDVDGSVSVIRTGTVNTSVAGTYYIHYTATDTAGNTASDQRVVNVVGADETPPVITVNGPNPVTVALGSVYQDAGATAVDDVDGQVAVSTTENNVDTSVAGTYQVRYRAVDSAGNSATATRTVYVSAVTDTTPPVIVITGQNPVNLTVGQNYQDAGATATDNVDGPVVVTTVSNNVNTNVPGSYSVTYRATDSAGNIATVTRTVIVSSGSGGDTTPPAITILGSNPVSILVGTPYVDAGATATDNVDGNITSGIVQENNVNPSVAGTYSVTYTVTDSSGNTAQASRIVQVVTSDQVPPQITIIGPNPVTLMIGDSYFDDGASAFDNIDGDVTNRIETINTVDTGLPGVYTVTYRVSDTAGNLNVAIRTVKVGASDTTPPVLTILGNNPLYLVVDSTFMDPGATALDDVDGNLTWRIERTDNIVNTVPGAYTVTYQVSDYSGNTALAQRGVMVISSDTTPPVIQILGDNPAYVETGITYFDAGATATDDVDDAAAVSARIVTQSDVNTGVPGQYQVTYSTADSSGNQASASRTVIVSSGDTVPPTITLLGDNPKYVLVGGPYIEAGATASDNIDDDTILTASIQISPAIDLNTPGTYAVRYNVSDRAGNAAAEVIREVHVVTSDTNPPVITLLGSNPLTVTLGTIYTDPGATADDDLDDDIYTTAKIEVTSTVDTSRTGTYTVRYNVTDSAGNPAQEVVRTVYVVSETSEVETPVLMSPADGATGITLIPVLMTGTANDPAVWNVRWQIAQDADFQNIVLDRKTTARVFSLPVPSLVLSAGQTTYYWRAMFTTRTGKISDWAAPWSFTTVSVTDDDADGNGTPDDQEVTDTTVDVDQNNTPDVDQDDITVVETPTGGVSGIQGGSGVSIISVTSVDPSTLPENPYADMSDELIAYSVTVDQPGGPGTVTIFLNQAAPDGSSWWVYDEISGTWYKIDNVTFSPDGSTVTVTVTDGSSLDADGTVNGTVVVQASGYGVAYTPGPGPGPAPSDDGGSGSSNNCFISSVSGENSVTGPAALGLMLFLFFITWNLSNEFRRRRRKKERQ